MSRLKFLNTPLVVLALLFGGGSLHAAATLAANPTSLTLSCDTVLGSTPATVGITLAAAGSAVNVTVSEPNGSPVVLPSPVSQSVSSTSVAVNYTFSVPAGCKGATNGQTVALTFTPSTGTALVVTATLNITSSASALAPSPSSVLLTCTKNGSVYTPGSSQTVNVTSAAPGGTPFTVDNTVNVLPSWLSVTSLSGGTASTTAVVLTFTPKAGCGGLSVGSTTFSVHLLNAPAPDRVVPVTIEIGAAAAISASVSPVALSYTTGSGTYTPVTTNISASPAVFFSVDQTTLPLWLNVSPSSGTTTSPVTLSFVPTAGVQTLAVGSYSANVHLKVSGDLDFVLPVSLAVKNPAATMSVVEGTTRSINWTLGSALPNLVITPVSSDAPIAYTVSTTAGSLSPQVSATSGIAYSFGSPISVSFLQAIFGAAAPGATLTGSVTITPASGSPITVNITVNVKAPGAAVTSASPAALPTASSGTFTVVLSGAGFVVSNDPTVATKVGVVNSGLIVSDSNIASTVVNSTSIVLTITAPSTSDPYLPFSGNGGTVTLGVCNPQGSNCSTPTGTVSIVIGVNPIVQAVTSASSFTQATPPALNSIAPYDILSVFGTNFCMSGGTGCSGQNAILYGTTDPVTERYPTSVSPDAAGATQRSLTVTFQTHGASPTVIASAPILFATNNQINIVAPDALKTYIGSPVDMVVSFGYGTGSTILKSSPYSVIVAATDPGVFTVGGDGQGEAAVLDNNALVTSSAPANIRSIGADSDIVSFYVTGLGVPDSQDGSNAWTGVACMAVADYFAAVNTATSASPALTSNDGLVLNPNYFPSNIIQPCLKSSSTDVPSVTIGGVAATVKFAGWVSGSVAGLYQINALLPAATANFTDVNGVSGAFGTSAKHLPVIITANGKSSQSTGVNMWLQQTLLVTSTGATSGAANSAWAGTTIATNDGAAPYAFAVSSGTLPAGLSLDASAGTVTGTPTATGSSTVVFQVTDNNGLQGTVSVTFTVN